MQHLPLQVHGDGPNGSRQLKLGMCAKVAIRTAVDMSSTNSFGFRATGKGNIFLCRYMGMAKMVLDSSNLCGKRWPSGLLWTCPPPTPDVALASGPEPKGVGGIHVFALERAQEGYITNITKFEAMFISQNLLLKRTKETNCRL